MASPVLATWSGRLARPLETEPIWTHDRCVTRSRRLDGEPLDRLEAAVAFAMREATSRRRAGRKANTGVDRKADLA